MVLVFALANGIFFAGVVSTLAMSVGTALTTGALAAMAVLAKNVALRFAGEGSQRGALVIKGFEAAAAAVVLFVGLSLLAATWAGEHLG